MSARTWNGSYSESTHPPRPSRRFYQPPQSRNPVSDAFYDNVERFNRSARGGGGARGRGGRGGGGRGRGLGRPMNPGFNDRSGPDPFWDADDLEEEEPAEPNAKAYDDVPVEATGKDIPEPVTSFSDLDISEPLRLNIARCKYAKPTPIQRYAIPVAMTGRDVMACAQTGSGKTAAFCFPIINGILTNQHSPSPNSAAFDGRRGGYTNSRAASPLALILAPTRELSCQIHEEANKFSRETGLKIAVAYGGAPMSQQLRNLERGVDILVATPGRLVDMMERSRVSLRGVKYLALDEADRMLDMGFERQVRTILEDMPPPGKRQTMLFSATFPAEIQGLASEFLSNYIFLSAGKVGSSTDRIDQKVEFLEEPGKRDFLRKLLQEQASPEARLTLVFVETKRGADALEHWLMRMGFKAVAIHGDKEQMERERALKSFKCGRTPILVATDVASRGLDIPNVSHVINFDLPRNIEHYVHRIGRTGRAGKSGLATAFFTAKNAPIAKDLVDLMQGANQEIPTWLNGYAEENPYGGDGHHRRSNGYRNNNYSGGGGGYGGYGNGGGGAAPPYYDDGGSNNFTYGASYDGGYSYSPAPAAENYGFEQLSIGTDDWA